jgi:glycosyltransferase involved in cell wall biosynthesis
LDEGAWDILYKRGGALQKVGAVIKGFLSRLWAVFFLARHYDYIFIHREASPLGPPIFEWLLAKLLRKRIVYDFDDAIWIPAVTESNSLAAAAKCFWKIKWICKWAWKVAAGNDFLATFAAAQGAQVTVVPTCVDTEHRFNRIKDQHSGRLTIGWTGSHSTLPYLDQVVPVLKGLGQHYDFDVLVICNQPPTFTLPNLRFLPWKEATEIDDLLNIHIGLMPLVSDAWSEGKCGFKIIQYLALGIPALASPVGVNKRIVTPGENGFLCATEAEWYSGMEALLQNAALRSKMGQIGRQKIEAAYSIEAHDATFLSLFE